MSGSGERTGMVTKILWGLGVPIVAGWVLYLAVPEVGPAFSAAYGKGKPGTFTATHLDCKSRDDCFWKGKYAAADGSSVRTDLELSGDKQPNNVGDTFQVKDTGSPTKVYAPGGTTNTDFYMYSGLVLVSIAFLIGWAVIELYLLHRLLFRAERSRQGQF